MHELDETKLIFGPDPDLYKLQMLWIFNHEQDSFSRVTTAFETGNIDTITWVCIDDEYYEVDRMGDFTTVNWYQPKDTDGVSTGEDLTLAYVIEKNEFDNIYMFSELLTYTGRGGEISFQAQRNGEIIEMRGIEMLISGDGTSLTVKTKGLNFFCSITDKPVCTQQKTLDDGSVLRIMHSAALQKVIFYPDPQNLNVELSWNLAPLQETFNRTTVWLEDGHSDTVVWSITETGLDQIGQEGIFEAIAWTDNLGNFGRYSKEDGEDPAAGGDGSSGSDGFFLPSLPSIELNYNLESHIFNDVYLFSESAKFSVTEAEVKFMLLFNGKMVDQGIFTAVKSVDMREVTINFGPVNSLSCQIQAGEETCTVDEMITPWTALTVIHSKTKTVVKYEPHLDLYPIVETWEFNHIL